VKQNIRLVESATTGGSKHELLEIRDKMMVMRKHNHHSIQ
jgi:hypothetical protein